MSNAADTAQVADQEEAARGLAPKKKPCWPDDPNYPDGYTEIDLPSERLLRAYFDTQILGGERRAPAPDHPRRRLLQGPLPPGAQGRALVLHLR